jgi:heavy metal efflux system protein
MLNKIIEFSVRNKLIIGLFTIALIIYGVYETARLPIDAVPDITNNQVQVITIAPSYGAADIERLVTFPIELANSNIPGLKEIRSFSRFGLSLITIVFEDDVDIYWARQQVTERLKIAETQIPKGLGTPELAPVTTGLGEIYQYVLRPKPGYESKYDAIALRTIQDWTVRRQLLGVKGVADVSSFGGKLKQYEIAIEPNKLKAYQVTIAEIFNALEKNNENTGGAFIEKHSTVLYIRTEGLLRSIEDIKKIVLKNQDNGVPLLLGDVAEVRIGSAIRYGAMTYNDQGEAAGAVVMMLKGANSNEVIQNVKERIKQIEKTLPEGVEIEAFLDRTKMVNNAISTVLKNLLEGALIVIFVLVLFLGNLRAGLLVASVIPLAMLFAIIMMNIFGVSGNLMSLGALDFGLIVDGAVIIVEAVMHNLHKRKVVGTKVSIHQKEMDIEVKSSASRMMNSAVFGQIIILIVYLPIFSLEGIEGKMFKPMAQTVAFALLGAFILSLTYIPMMSSIVISNKLGHKKNFSDRIMDYVTLIHQNYLKKVLGFPKTVISISIIMLAIALFAFTRMGGEFIPDLPEGDFAIETRVLTGSNINTTVDACLKGAHILKTKFPEVEKVVGKIGSGEIPTDPMPMEAADLMVILKPKDEWTSAKTWEELAEKMSEELKEVPGVTFGFQYPVAMRFNELMTGAKQDVVCKLFGENLDTLSKYSKVIGAMANKIEGAENVYVEPIDGLPQLVIKYKRELIARYGLNIADVNRVVNIAFAGQSSGLIFEDEKRFDLVLRLAGENRKNIEDVENLLIPNASGNQIPLSQVADITVVQSVNQIQRDDAKRRIFVGFNVIGRDVESTVKDLQKVIAAEIKLPSGYYITYSGAFENLNAAKKRLMVAVPISLALILILLYFAFGSLKQGLLIYSAIPLSAIGGILFLYLRGMPFSISAGVGFIALFGVSVLNGIVLLSEFNRIKASGETNPLNIVLSGTAYRLRPVLMTAFVASLGFLPMALSAGAGAEVQKPLATVVIGGLIISTFLTLFVLPILYILFEKVSKRKGEAAIPVLLAMIFFGFSANANAQQFVSLEEANQMAMKNNLSIKNEVLKAAYKEQLIKTAHDLPMTEISGEYGQINSSYRDNRIGIVQTINFPTVYTNQKAVNREEWNTAVLEIRLEEAAVKKAVAHYYYSILTLREKEKLLLSADSTYSQFLEKALLRLNKGEANLLEKVTAETQRRAIQLQLQGLKQELALTLVQFRLLLNTPGNIEPAAIEPKIIYSPLADTASLKLHPRLKIAEQKSLLAQRSIKLEQSRLLPDIGLAYNNMSMLGTGSDNVLYNSSTRFHSAQLKIAVPLFMGARRARINAGRLSKDIAENNLVLQKQNLNAEYRNALIQLSNSEIALAYFEQTGLINARLILETASLQFASGEINYLDWVMLTNQAISIRTDYLDALNQYNENVITLNFLTSRQ